MNTWLVIILVWIGLGVVVLVVERALRGATQDSLLDSLDSILFAVAMLILAPFLLTYFLALVISQPIVTLWRGTIPFLDKPWWPERAKKFEPPAVKSSELQSDDSTLCQMIELRRGREPIRRRGPHPSRVPMCDHWRTPEHVIY